jgi:antitoxin (DNA-binding transcriptional repressor) of toxin-antitoxin stability system
MVVNVFEAKTQLSRLLRLIEMGRESSVIIARNGRPIARIVPLKSSPVSRRIGVARGRFTVPDNFDDVDDKIVSLMTGGDL